MTDETSFRPPHRVSAVPPAAVDESQVTGQVKNLLELTQEVLSFDPVREPDGSLIPVSEIRVAPTTEVPSITDFGEVPEVEASLIRSDEIGPMKQVFWGLFIDYDNWVRCQREYQFVLFLHEATHIVVASHSDTFWFGFADHLKRFRERADAVEEILGPLDWDWVDRFALHHINPEQLEGVFDVGDNLDHGEAYSERIREMAESMLIEFGGTIEYDISRFERLGFPVTDTGPLSDARIKRREEGWWEFKSGPETYLEFMVPLSKHEQALVIQPEWLQRPDVDETRAKNAADWYWENGCPTLMHPVVEPTEDGQFRVLEGELTAVLALYSGRNSIPVFLEKAPELDPKVEQLSVNLDDVCK